MEAVSYAGYINVHKRTREPQVHILFLIFLDPVERGLLLEQDSNRWMMLFYSAGTTRPALKEVHTHE